ncbi:hypothetical protein CXB51_029725 [Gossypium anomalum]|uniref:Integrase catalytic domain-containing protein n=1 Tax=Gossypium anomalum TaxID=47600 RepID=A0A8J5XZG7_9ROSI|nr:hypothetical protein CXB51_029725 [Gossypium anomalum]
MTMMLRSSIGYLVKVCNSTGQTSVVRWGVNSTERHVLDLPMDGSTIIYTLPTLLEQKVVSEPKTRPKIANTRLAVEIFDDTSHFGMWQSEVLDELFQQGLDIAIDEKNPDDVQEKDWKAINRLACGTIRSCLSREQRYAFSKETSANKLWVALEENFLKKNSQNKLHLKKRLFRFTYIPGTIMNDHITKFNQLVTDLLNMDEIFKDEDLALMLLGSLPEEFEFLETTLLHGKSDISLSEFCAALYSYEQRKKDKQKNSIRDTEALVARGHSYTRRKTQKGDQSQSPDLGKMNHDTSDSELSSVASSSSFHSDEWILDLGCTYHMSPNREWFSDLVELNGGVVYMGNDNACKTVGIGSIQLKNQDGSTRVLTDVRYVPSLKKNLISLGALESKGSVVTMRDRALKVTSGALVILKGIRKNNLYYYQGSTVIGPVAAASDNKELDSMQLWHMKLGDASEKSLKILAKQGLLKGAKACKLKYCEHCVLGKQKRVKFGTAIHNTKGILEYVHSDVWGPSKAPSLGGKHYFVTFVDDFSRRVWVYTMRTKYEVLEFFLKWKTMIENQTGKKIKWLRTDNGGEYKNDPFFDVCQEHGIVRHFTIRDTPQQNGVAERMNRTLLEKVRCMLSNAGLGKQFWAEAVTYAGHLVNRLPSSALERKTPMEVWSGKPATDYDSLHVFGSTAYYHVKESKLDPRAKKALFMGITSGVKGFRLWCLDTKKIICSRDVTFDESATLKKVADEDIQTGDTPQQVDCTPKQVEFEQVRICPVNKFNSPATIEELEVEEVLTQELLSTPEPVAVARPRREIRRPARFTDMVAYALPVVDDDIPVTYQEAMESLESDKWKSAMDEEMQSLRKNNTWELAQLPKGKRAIGCKWVFAKKDGSPSKKDVRYKARLVAKGYAQKEGIDYNDVFSPVVKHSSIRILLALVAQLNLELAQLDVNTAFLHGELEEEIYMTQPKGYEDAGGRNWVCKLNKSLYRLKQSPRQWYKRFDNFMRKQKYTRSKYDNCSQKEIDKLKAQLNQEFEMKDLGEAKKILVGSLIYAMVWTRHDISQAVGVVSRYMHDPGKGHWQAVKWILRYLRKTIDVGLVFEQDEALGQFVVGYVDSDFAGDLDKRRSTTGYLFTLAKAPVSWKSTLQSTVAISTTEAEYMAVIEAVKEAIWLNGLLEDLGVVQSHISLYCDSQSAIHLAKNQVYHSRTKHIDVRYHFVREVFKKGKILLQKIPTADNPADMMTKVVTIIKFNHCLNLINILRI